MIDPRAIDAFLSRDLRDSAKAKQFTERALMAKLNALEPRPEFVTKPYPHQIVCFLLALERFGYFFQVDMGLGKTKVMIDVFRYLLRTEQEERMIVLVPSVSNVGEWGRELDKHGPDLSYALLDESMLKLQRETIFWEEQHDVTVLTYQGFIHLLCVKKGKSNGSGKKFVVDQRKVDRLADVGLMLVCDESTALKNHRSLSFQLLRKLSHRIDTRYCLSGTPFSSDPQALWSQFYVCDNGNTLGQTLGMYRACFFNEIQTPWAIEWKLKKRAEGDLHRMLRHGSIRYEETECQALPPVVGGIDNLLYRSEPMCREQIRHHDILYDEMREARADGERVEAIYYKMRCLASGYIPTEVGFSDFKINPKRDMLMQVLEECGGKKVIVFFHFHHTGDLVKAALKKLKIKYAEISGRVKKKSEQIEKFRNSAQVLLASGAGAYGLNLQFCSRTVFFETPDSIAPRRQMEKRTHRHGQNSTVYFYDLVVRGTVDSKILTALREGKRVLDVVIDGNATH